MGDIHSGYWEIAKDGMYGVANRPNGTAHKYFAGAPYKVAAKSGTAQVFGLKANETYNAHKIAERLRDHKLMTAFAPYDNPQVAVAMILENGGAGWRRWVPSCVKSSTTSCWVTTTPNSQLKTRQPLRRRTNNHDG